MLSYTLRATIVFQPWPGFLNQNGEHCAGELLAEHQGPILAWGGPLCGCNAKPMALKREIEEQDKRSTAGNLFRLSKLSRTVQAAGPSNLLRKGAYMLVGVLPCLRLSNKKQALSSKWTASTWPESHRFSAAAQL